MSVQPAPSPRGPAADEVIGALEAALEAQPDVAFAYLFGSVAKGRAVARSDVDVAVCLGGAVDASHDRPRIARRALEIEAELERRIRRPVQVVALDIAPLELTQNVLRSGRLIVSRDDRIRARFFEDHVRCYLDLGHARDIFARYMDRRIREGRFGGGTRNRP